MSWIKTSTKLPPTNTRVLSSLNNGVDIVIRVNDNQWCTQDYKVWFSSDSITSWKHLPKPYLSPEDKKYLQSKGE